MLELSTKDKETILDHYLTCALWASNDDRTDQDIPLDRDYSPSDLDPSDKPALMLMIDRFIELAGSKLEQYFNDHNLEQLGHDLFLTQNGHGTGFWDRKYSDPDLGDFLTEICDKLGESVPYVNDDNKISFYIPF